MTWAGRTQFHTLLLGNSQSAFRSVTNVTRFLRSHNGAEFNHCLILLRRVGAHELDLLLHQPRDEMRIAGKSVQFSDDKRGLVHLSKQDSLL